MTPKEKEQVLEKWNALSPEEQAQIGWSICFQKAKADFLRTQAPKTDAVALMRKTLGRLTPFVP
jgi:hypothetical protein